MNRTDTGLAAFALALAFGLLMLAGWSYMRSALLSKDLTRQHSLCVAEQGLPSDACCRVGRAWVCPLAMKESNDE